MSKYVVRLVMSLEADAPDEAVRDFVDQLTAYGLRDWIFRAEKDDAVEGYYNGFGKSVDLDAATASLRAQTAAQAEAEDEATVPSEAPAVSGESDAALTAIAESLNATAAQ